MLLNLNRVNNSKASSYIIGLEEPGHGKEGLRSLCGPKMLSLSKQICRSEEELTC